MSNPLWSDSGTWIALGVTFITIVAALIMHRVIVKVLKTPPPPEPDTPDHEK